MVAGCSSAIAGEHSLVIGDSLTKEYQSEFPLLYPNNPKAWNARNWCEILHDRRNAYFDLGSWGTYADFRLTGHAYNFAKPGGTSREARNFLVQDSQARTEVLNSSGGALLWLAYPTWRDTFDDMLSDADTAIIFFGGNDLASGNTDPEANPKVDGKETEVTYQTIYNGNKGAASDPDRMRRSLRNNIRELIKYQREKRKFKGPMVLVSVPHVGCTPKIQKDVGTDPAKTQRVTTMLEELNEELREMAEEYDMGFADVFSVTNRLRTEDPFTIGGITFSKNPDPDCGPRSLFSGDGFHPNTPLQAKVAQLVIDAFREKYPSSHDKVRRLTDREIITEVLKLDADLGYREWLEAAGVPSNQRRPQDDPDGDGVPNVLEFALAGRHPNGTQEPAMGEVRMEATGGSPALCYDYQPRFEENAYCSLRVEVSADLKDWDPAPESAYTQQPDGRVTVRMPADSGAVFLRLVAEVED